MALWFLRYTERDFYIVSKIFKKNILKLIIIMLQKKTIFQLLYI